MSTDANAALAWPIEITESALIGDQLAHDLNQPDLFDSPVGDIHFGSYTWLVGGQNEGAVPLTPCGTGVPGAVRLPALRETSVGLHRDYPEAGMVWSEAAMAWRIRSFIGDPIGDPHVREEGTRVPMWALTPGGKRINPDGSYTDLRGEVPF